MCGGVHTTFLLCLGEERNKVLTLYCEATLDVAGYDLTVSLILCISGSNESKLMPLKVQVGLVGGLKVDCQLTTNCQLFLLWCLILVVDKN